MARGEPARYGKGDEHIRQWGQMHPVLSFGDPRKVVALGRDYIDRTMISPHAHDRAQFLYGLTGLTVVNTEEGTWMIPPDRGMWIPAGKIHEVRMVGAVRMCSAYVLSSAASVMPQVCAVLAVTDLVRTLLAEAVALPEPPIPATGSARDEALIALLLQELPRLESVSLSVPLPASPGLRALCEALLREPRSHMTIDACCRTLHMSRRNFTRCLKTETGLSFGGWRQRACVLVAIPRLLQGMTVARIALDLGYDNPAAFSTMFRRITGEKPSRYTGRGTME